jgi:hypothetical protein
MSAAHVCEEGHTAANSDGKARWLITAQWHGGPHGRA